MGFFTSPPLTVNDVFEWLNELLGVHIPTIPLPSSWFASLRRLWNTYILGELPNPDEPKPWRIDIEGSWQPFSSCNATFECLSIVVYDAGTIVSPMPCSPASPPDPDSEPPPEPKTKAPAKRARAPAKKKVSSPITSPDRGKKRRKS